MSRAMMRPCGPEPRRRERSMPASLASRRANGVTKAPPGSFAGPKLRSGVRTSKNGSSLIGCAGWRGCGAGAAGFAGAAFGGAAAAGGLEGELAATPEPSAMTPTTAPTGAISPAATRISLKVPVVVDGTSIDTLSVSISNRLSPGFTGSPADLNHLVILPSATVSPSCGISTSIVTIPEAASRNAFPSHFHRRVRRPQDQPIAGEFVAANQVGVIARLETVQAMMRDGPGHLVDRIGAEIGDVIGQRDLGLFGRHHRAGLRAFDVGRDLHRHLAVRAVIDHALRIRAAIPAPTVDLRADIAPGTAQLLGDFTLAHRSLARLTMSPRCIEFP